MNKQHIFFVDGKSLTLIGEFDYETSLCICDQLMAQNMVNHKDKQK